MQRALGKTGDTDFSLFTLSLRWDTLDDPAFPGTGTHHEWTYERSENSLWGAFGGAVDTERFTVTDRRYRWLHPHLVCATRTLFEILDGEVPMDLYSEVGSSLDRWGFALPLESGFHHAHRDGALGGAEFHDRHFCRCAEGDKSIPIDEI